jgi:predicted small secreted protein
MSKQLRMLVLLAATALAGCGTIDAGDIQAFGAATTAVAEAARDARTIDNTLARAIRTEGEATLFASNHGSYRFPPAYRPTQATGAAWDVRIAYATALADYGKALALAASGVQGADIEGAVDNLKAAFTATAPKLAENKNFEPIADATSIAVRQAITQIAWQRIKRAMQRAHPSIVKGRDLLAADFDKVSSQAQRHYDDWVISKQAALKAIRASSSGKERYEAYRAFLIEQQGLAASIELLVPARTGAQPGYVALLDNMVVAHKQLADGEQNPVVLADFLAAAQQFEGLAKIFAGNGGS